MSASFLCSGSTATLGRERGVLLITMPALRPRGLLIVCFGEAPAILSTPSEGSTQWGCTFHGLRIKVFHGLAGKPDGAEGRSPSVGDPTARPTEAKSTQSRWSWTKASSSLAWSLMRRCSCLIPRLRRGLPAVILPVIEPSKSVPGLQKNSSSICSNSLVLKVKLPA